jgi:tRNA-specific 2-thiouridylase
LRRRARELLLANADKPESQEICFVPDGDYARFVEHNPAYGRARSGRIVDGGGRTLAAHAGVHRFTVGQRRGLGIAAGEPLYVRAIDAASGDVTVGRRDELISDGLIANRVSLTDRRLVRAGEIAAEVKIRYRHPGLPAILRIHDGDRAEVRFRHGGPAVTPGQACVFYQGDEVLGGVFIERALDRYDAFRDRDSRMQG